MATNKTFDYQQLHRELDQLLEAMQAGDMDIDEATKAYKRGQEIITQLETYLKAAELKVTKLTKDFSA